MPLTNLHLHIRRGNCPTLNTLANHGYLDRSGITTFAEAANAIQTAYSMAFDISIILSAFGLLAGGDIVTGKYSIAGKDDRVPNTIGPAYGIGECCFASVESWRTVLTVAPPLPQTDTEPLSSTAPSRDLTRV